MKYTLLTTYADTASGGTCSAWITVWSSPPPDELASKMLSAYPHITRLHNLSITPIREDGQEDFSQTKHFQFNPPIVRGG